MKCLLKPFAHVYWVTYFLNTEVVFWIQTFSDRYDLQTFCLCGLIFHSIGVVCRFKTFNFNKLQLYQFISYIVFGLIPEKPLPNLNLHSFCPVILLESFSLRCYICVCDLCWFLKIWQEVYVDVHFKMWISQIFQYYYLKTILSQLNCLYTFIKSTDYRPVGL